MDWTSMPLNEGETIVGGIQPNRYVQRADGYVRSVNGQTGDVTISTGGVTDGDKGDITVSGGGATWTVDPGVVTPAKMADVGTGTVFYRKTAGTGAPETQTLATLKADLGLSGTNSGDQTSIVGISGTLSQFNTAITDADIMPTSGGTFTGDISVPFEAYGGSWDSVNEVPTKAATYTAMEERQIRLGGAALPTLTLDFNDRIILQDNDGSGELGTNTVGDVRDAMLALVQMSVTADASGYRLVNDEDAPGNSEYYGTDSSGTKGYYPLPESYNYLMSDGGFV